MLHIMEPIHLAFVGFGNVLRALAVLLQEKAPLIQQKYNIQVQVVGIATHSHGIAIDPAGIDLASALQADDLSVLHRYEPVSDSLSFIRHCPADIILEASWGNPRDGQPAIDHIRSALQAGKHVVTANKGPIAFAYRELKALADEKGLGFFFESTIMDGVPVHLIGRDGLLAAKITRLRGVLNSTTNAILTRMEEGESFEDALREMQERGTAEADPSHDIDGWDAALKIALLANVLMGADLRPADANPVGIREISAEDISAASLEGFVIKLVAEAFYDKTGKVQIAVSPQRVAPDDPLAWLNHSANALTLETDVIDSITITESPADPMATAYGMLVDTLNIIRGRR